MIPRWQLPSELSGTALSRVAGFIRATDRLAKITRQQVSVAHAIVPTIGRSAAQESAHATRAGSGDAPQSADTMSAIHKFAANVNALDAAVRVGEQAHVDQPRRANAQLSRSPEMDSQVVSRARSFSMIQQSLSGIETLTRIQGSGRATSIEWKREDSAGRAKRALGIVGRLSIRESSREQGPRFKPRNFDRVLASAGKPAPPATRSMIAPARFSQPEFAEPTRGVYGQESRSTPGAITINSTPTVVINPGEAAGDVERQVIGALRAHREELFDQFKRESIRRERVQF